MPQRLLAVTALFGLLVVAFLWNNKSSAPPPEWASYQTAPIIAEGGWGDLRFGQTTMESVLTRFGPTSDVILEAGDESYVVLRYLDRAVKLRFGATTQECNRAILSGGMREVAQALRRDPAAYFAERPQCTPNIVLIGLTITDYEDEWRYTGPVTYRGRTTIPFALTAGEGFAFLANLESSPGAIDVAMIERVMKGDFDGVGVDGSSLYARDGSLRWELDRALVTPLELLPVEDRDDAPRVKAFEINLLREDVPAWRGGGSQ